jgi:hypothetical protein
MRTEPINLASAITSGIIEQKGGKDDGNAQIQNNSFFRVFVIISASFVF